MRPASERAFLRRRLARRGVAGKVAAGWIFGPPANQFTATVLPDTNVRTIQDFVRLGARQSATPSVNDATTRQECPHFGHEGFGRCSFECIWEQPHTDGPESFWSTMKRGQRSYLRRNKCQAPRAPRETYSMSTAILQLDPSVGATAGRSELAIRVEANEKYRRLRWPAPFDHTTHRLVHGDARDLAGLDDESVHLIVTSPPYWTLKEYPSADGQLGNVPDYELFLSDLDRAWRECERVLVPGGRICCVVGDVCVPRKNHGRHYIVPLHADIQVRSRALGLDCLTPVIWQKIANGVHEASGNGAGYYGKPYEPGAVVKNDIEYILFLRKGSGYRSPTPTQRDLSMLTKTEMQAWFRSVWSDIRGASTRGGHPAPYPPSLAERLIRMFSFAGDTVLDPFAGSCSTLVAAMRSGRNSVGIEIESSYIQRARERLGVELQRHRFNANTTAALAADEVW